MCFQVVTDILVIVYGVFLSDGLRTDSMRHLVLKRRESDIRQPNSVETGTLRLNPGNIDSRFYQGITQMSHLPHHHTDDAHG